MQDMSFNNCYGLLGLNGCAKFTLLIVIGYHEVPILEYMYGYLTFNT
jgi:ATPase subunit of ABC transporter with duplicated ATPase domains